MIRVVVIAGMPALRAGLRAMLEADPEIRVVTEAASPFEQGHAPEADVAVVVLDSVVTETGWLALGEAPPVLFLVETPEAVDFLPRLSPLVYGVLPLGASGGQLRAAVRALRAGLCVWAPDLFRWASPSKASVPEAALDEPLTPRELEVLQLMAQGLANKEIAARLGIRERTVKFHISSIYSKLGAANRAEAVRIGLRRGLIPL